MVTEIGKSLEKIGKFLLDSQIFFLNELTGKCDNLYY